MLGSGDFAFLRQIYPFIEGFTVLFWVVATWWIPLLLILGAWRFIIQKAELLNYDFRYWGMVFPIGMYTICTYDLSKATGLQFLMAIPRVFLFISIFTWGLALLGLLRTVVRTFLAKP